MPRSLRVRIVTTTTTGSGKTRIKKTFISFPIFEKIRKFSSH
ncbi:hypothetical protein NARC_10395 [Candidatus Nitrosocosmicus arcticus]|uniref:Uncharacterized protein n=1 Tax=Candidatus Nitrosocosmicus arcticus TaxID=2035267 RepID=A0A557SZF7_9ARCH|nr:hypothetical protein NARC_10395 [Candidatus Nitrosocosmicus arcticus]